MLRLFFIRNHSVAQQGMYCCTSLPAPLSLPCNVNCDPTTGAHRYFLQYFPKAGIARYLNQPIANLPQSYLIYLPISTAPNHASAFCILFCILQVRPTAITHLPTPRLGTRRGWLPPFSLSNQITSNRENE